MNISLPFFRFVLRNACPLFAAAVILGGTAECLHAAGLPEPVIPNTWGVQLKGQNSTPNDMAAIKGLGLKWVRKGFAWEGVEKQKGVYDFSGLDKFMNDAKAHGLSVIGCIAFSNKLYGHAKDEPARSAYARYAAALASHYKNYDVIWEIWNEPNTMTFWGRHGGVGNSEQYANEYYSLVAVTAPAIHKANPQAIVLGGAVSGLWSASFNWTEFCFKKGILKTGIDVWSVHPYIGSCPEDYLLAYEKMRGMMVAAGASKDFPVINSERGFPIGKAEGYAGGDPALSLEYQAWHCVRQYLIDMLCGVKVTSWYEWSGKEGFSLHNPATPTPASKAVKVLVDQLSGYRLDKRVDIGAPLDFVLRFTNGRGAVKLVAWTTAPPRESNPTYDKEREMGGTQMSAPPDKIVPHAAKIPVEAAGSVPVSQIYGQPGTAMVSGGTVELKLTGAPQYVTVHH